MVEAMRARNVSPVREELERSRSAWPTRKMQGRAEHLRIQLGFAPQTGQPWRTEPRPDLVGDFHILTQALLPPSTVGWRPLVFFPRALSRSSGAPLTESSNDRPASAW